MATKKIVEKKKAYGKVKSPLEMSGAMKTAVETAKARKTDVGGGGTKGLIGRAVEAAKAKKTATTPAPKMKKC